VGGGSNSQVFGQIKADVLGAPVSTIQQADTAALGCAVIAGYGVGLYDSLTTPIEAASAIRATIEPNPELYAFYQARKDIYGDIFPALHGVYEKLGKL